ncbi:protein kinase domain-containing protein [Haloferula sp.]|uniref:protein kinase domain-containing protein n=1 Tax=Haloferula sp. TaxID=2497595 RepID=UPI00329D3F67
MTNKDTGQCSRCGTKISEDTAGGLCPKCLMAHNFETRTMPEGEPAASVPALSPEEMREHFPQFEIIECLGRGGMGVVYKARQKTLDRMVAIKVLAGEWQGEAGFAERFEREAKTLAQMSHPNIVTVHDFGETGGLYFIVMEYVDGVNLRDLMGEGKMAAEQALAIVPPVCEALEYAHEKGVVHRDIKPENLLLDREGRVKIADFGIASLAGVSGERSGTPIYMAPEQEEGMVDRRADIYALGVVLYEMLTGDRPAKDVVAPSRRVEVDVKIDEMVLRALEKEPEKRYQTAGEFRTVVQTLSGQPTPVAAMEKPKRSRKVLLIFGCLGICLIALAIPIVAVLIAFKPRGSASEEVVSPDEGQRLSFRGRPKGLSKAELGDLRAASNVVSIDLMDTRLTDGLLQIVGSHRKLERLNLGCSIRSKSPQMTDERLKYLSGCQNLKALILHGNPITDAGLAHLDSLPRLELLQLGGTEVSGEGLKHLPHLTWLRLDATPITDDGLEPVARMRNLEQLYLDITDVSDAGLVHLRGLKKLRSLNLHSAKVTAAGVGALKQSLPGLSIGWNRESPLGEDGFQMERTIELHRSATLQNSFVDLDTGTLLGLPEDLVDKLKNSGRLNEGNPQVLSISEWAADCGADLFLPVDSNQVIILEGFCIEGEKNFDAFTVSDVRAFSRTMNEMEFGKAAENPTSHMSIGINPSPESRRSAIFQTREGGSGAVEITELGKGSQRVRVRFKLIEK